jgi:hypothetical protein
MLRFFYPLYPCIYILFIVTSRFFIERLPRTVFISLKSIQIIFICVTLLVLLVRLLLLVKKAYFTNTNSKNPVFKHIKKTLESVNYWITERWKYIYYVFYNAYDLIGTLILFVARQLINIKPNFSLFLVILLELTPKIVLITLFLIEFYVYKNICYFYKLLVLYLIPLVFRALTGIFQQYYMDNKQEMETSIKLSQDSNITITISYRGHVIKSEIFIKFFAEPVLHLNQVLNDLEYAKKALCSTQIDIIITLLFIFAWVRILLAGIL